jgi:hypothetical protein
MRLQVLVVGTALALNFRRAGAWPTRGVVRRATGRTLTEQAHQSAHWADRSGF